MKTICGTLRIFALSGICLLPAISSIRAQVGQPAAKVVRVDGKAQRKMLTHEVKPTYPPTAIEKQIEGTVRLEIIIGTNGKVRQLRVLSGQVLLAQAALEAVRKWEYRPTTFDGSPVEVATTVDVVFKLP